MTPELRFFVPGFPAPGGSKRAFPIKKGGVFTGRVAVVDAGGQKTKDWRASVSLAGFEAMKQVDLAPWTGALEVELIFHMPRPKGHFRTDGLRLRDNVPSAPITRPDLGKLCRSTVDALTGTVWRDDAQIVKESHEKAYSDRPGCWIVVKEWLGVVTDYAPAGIEQAGVVALDGAGQSISGTVVKELSVPVLAESGKCMDARSSRDADEAGESIETRGNTQDSPGAQTFIAEIGGINYICSGDRTPGGTFTRVRKAGPADIMNIPA